MAGYDDLSARADAAKGMMGGGGGGDMGAPPPPPEDTGAMGDAEDMTAIQSALDGIAQAADSFGPDVAQEIRSHVNAIRELVSQGEAGKTEEQAVPALEESAGNASPTPETQMPIESAGGMTP